MTDSSKVHIKVVLLRSNPVTYDVRVLKEAKILLDNGYSVSTLGWDRENKFNFHDSIDGIPVDRIKIYSSYGSGIRNIWPLLKWQFSEFLYLLKHDFDIAHACDFDTVIPVYIVARFKRKKVIYDIFDFYADSLIKVPNIFKELITKIDLFIIRHVDGVILCDEFRKEEINYHKNSVCIFYNTPEDLFFVLQQKYNNTENQIFTLCYIGYLDNRLRDLMQFIRAVNKFEDIVFKIGGSGPSEKEIVEEARKFPYIKFLGRLNYKKALEEEFKSDVIVCPYNPAFKANIYASPNKLFEAMMLAKPVLMNRGIKISEIVEQNNLGILYDYGNTESIRKAILQLISNRQLCQTMGENGRKLYEEKYSALNNANNLINLYKKLIKII
jgi:glycosyltransferase involved in cell wall biosynthesis